MGTNGEKLLFKDGVFQIIGCAIEILNTLGHGIIEKLYKGQKVGPFVPDHIVFNSIVTNLRVGVILNFKRRKLEWARIVL
jgi:hypothetical protein